MADTAAQAQARKVIGLPGDQEWSDANVATHLRRQGFTDPSFLKEVLANGTGESNSIANMTPVNVFKGYNLPEGGRYTANDPMARNSQFTDTKTGQTLTGGLDPTGRSIVTGFGRGNPQNTVQYDTMTGKKTEAMPHPWLDAAKNTAMIWGGPETAGALMGAWGGAAGASAASSGAGASHMPMVGGGWIGANAAPAAGTTAATGGHSLATAMALNAAENAAVTKASGGSWGQAALAGGIGAGTAGLAPGLATLGPAARTAANFGISQGASAAMRAAGGKNSTNTYGRGSESTGLGPTQGRMQQGFGYSTSNPDLSSILSQGKREAVRDQPFRRGYDITTGYNDDKTPITYSMPPIGKYAIPRNGGGQRKKKPSLLAPPTTDSGSEPVEPPTEKQPRDY